MKRAEDGVALERRIRPRIRACDDLMAHGRQDERGLFRPEELREVDRERLRSAVRREHRSLDG